MEEIIQQSVFVEEPAYGRYEARYAQTEKERERERGTKRYNSINKNATVTNEQPTFTKGYKVTIFSDSLRATALYANYISGPNLGYQRG